MPTAYGMLEISSHRNRSDAHIQSLALNRAEKNRTLVIHIRLATENKFYGQNLRQ